MAYDKNKLATIGQMQTFGTRVNAEVATKTSSVSNSKADKVSSATNGNLAALDANGNLTDSGIPKTTVTGYASTLQGKTDKVTGATADRVAVFVSGGGLKDSGVLYTDLVKKSDIATDAEMTEMMNEVFGS